MRCPVIVGAQGIDFGVSTGNSPVAAHRIRAEGTAMKTTPAT
jgi:hypothetical protein